MKHCFVRFALVAAFLGSASIAFAQDETSDQKPAPSGGDIKFVATGYFFSGAAWAPPANGEPEKLTFGETSINPVLLWSIGDNLIVESEIELQLQGQGSMEASPTGYAVGEGLSIDLEFANLSYILNDYLTFRVGTFISSVGVLQDWYHTPIANRFTDAPIGFGHGGLEPGSDLGFNITGGIPLGSAKMNYSVDLTTGPRLITEPGNEEGNQGQLIFEGINDNNINKNIGVKLGILPFSNSSLEFGGSFNTALVGNVNSEYSGIGATSLAGYLSLIQDIDALSGTLLFRGQYDQLKIDDASYAVADDTVGKTFTFNNVSSAYYAQLSYRPTMIDNKILRKLEIGARLADLSYPKDAPWGKEISQFAVSLIYWVHWNTLIKLQYEANHVVSQTEGTIVQPPAQLFLQMTMGF